MKGGDILIECLKGQGITAVFGMPDTQNIHIYDALLRRATGKSANELGNSSALFFGTPPDGLEPPTRWLTAICSTD